MFERFTPEARSALFAARWVAEATGGTEIRPEHLVTGVLTVAPGFLSSEQTAAVITQLGHSERLALSTPLRHRPSRGPRPTPISSRLVRPCMLS
jgi:hypothetical protein